MRIFSLIGMIALSCQEEIGSDIIVTFEFIQERIWSRTAFNGDLTALDWVPPHCILSVVNTYALQDLHSKWYSNSFSMHIHQPQLAYTPKGYFLLPDNRQTNSDPRT